MLTVVTHTRHERPDLLERCKTSVLAGLPSGADHRIIPCYSNFEQARYDAALLNEFVAFVDDDDYIDPRALQLCLDALNETGAGLAVTNEVIVNIEGRELFPNRAAKTYAGIGIHPRTAHHLSVMRRSCIDEGVLELSSKFNLGTDWLLRANAALVGGAIHVPIDGYFWTRHEHQHTAHHVEHNQQYSKKMSAMGDAIRKMWRRPDGPVPIYKLP